MCSLIVPVSGTSEPGGSGRPALWAPGRPAAHDGTAGQGQVAAPRTALKVLDDAIQAHGGGGMCDDFPLAYAYAHSRTLRLADGPDEVHRNAIAKVELGKAGGNK